jgi:replicative DNA helicase
MVDDSEQVLEIPHDSFNESVIIATALSGGEDIGDLVRSVRADWFHGEGHAAIWTAIAEVVRRNLQCDVATVRQVGGEAIDDSYLAKIADDCDGAANIAHHIETLRWDHARFEAVAGPVRHLLLALRDPTTAPERTLSLARQVPIAFEGYGSRDYLHDSECLIRDQIAEISRRRKRAVYPYGIEGFDSDEHGNWRIVPGAAPSQVTVVTACSGSGKSTVTARIALEQARKRRRVLYGAWEMTGGVTLELLATLSLGWSRHKVAIGNLDDDELIEFGDRMEAISEFVRFVKLPFGRTPRDRWTNDEALDAVHGYIADTASDVAVFDLWKRGLRDDKPSEEEFALIRMQTIADETRCHLILCQQQRLKDVEKRNDKRPTREGIKGSGAWVEIPDTIIGVHLPSLWQGNLPDNVIELILLKQRYGKWPLAIEFDWDGDRATLTNGRQVDLTTTNDPAGSFGDYIRRR